MLFNLQGIFIEEEIYIIVNEDLLREDLEGENLLKEYLLQEDKMVYFYVFRVDGGVREFFLFFLLYVLKVWIVEDCYVAVTRVFFVLH